MAIQSRNHKVAFETYPSRGSAVTQGTLNQAPPPSLHSIPRDRYSAGNHAGRDAAVWPVRPLLIRTGPGTWKKPIRRTAAHYETGGQLRLARLVQFIAPLRRTLWSARTQQKTFNWPRCAAADQQSGNVY